MKKVLVLGHKGMLGHVVYDYLKENKYKVITYKGDATEFEKLEKFINKKNPDVVINCIGKLNVCKDRQQQILVNTVLPQVLSQFSKRLIHISTNCVFKDIGPHEEYEEPNATDLYGVCKGMGEIDNDKDLTIRTSIIGPELKEDGSGLFQWVMKQDKYLINGYKNIYWNGVTTLQLAKFIELVMFKKEYGLINYYSDKEISKYELIKLIVDIFKLGEHSVNIVYKNAHQSLLTGDYYSLISIKRQLQKLKKWYKHPIQQSLPT